MPYAQKHIPFVPLLKNTMIRIPAPDNPSLRPTPAWGKIRTAALASVRAAYLRGQGSPLRRLRVGYSLLCAFLLIFYALPLRPAPEMPDLQSFNTQEMAPGEVRAPVSSSAPMLADLTPGEVRAPIFQNSAPQPADADTDSAAPRTPGAQDKAAQTTPQSGSGTLFHPVSIYAMENIAPSTPETGGIGILDTPALATLTPSDVERKLSEAASMPRQQRLADSLPGYKVSGNGAPPGLLSAHFESGADGAASVGHPPRGGTSYGTFQIASGTSTFGNFMQYLQKHAPDIAAKLQESGPANTGSTQGALPSEWRRIASEEPKRFARLQYQFVLRTHYEPALAAITATTGVDIAGLSPAMREVLWSTAVQHGPNGAAEIFAEAIDDLKGQETEKPATEIFEKALIEKVYHLRKQTCGKRGQSIASRFNREMELALTLLDKHYDSGS